MPTPRYHAVIAASAEIARAMQHPYVGVEHLFLAMIRDPQAVPSQILAQIASPDEIEAALIDTMTSPAYLTPTRDAQDGPGAEGAD